MGVTDGQAVSAGVTNPAFIDANSDDTGFGIITLANTDPLSGAIITNIQGLMNQLRISTGATETAPATTYTSSQRIQIGDNYQTAISKLDTAFNLATGHKHTGVSGDGPAISSVTPNANTATTGLYGLSILASVPAQPVGSLSASGTANGFVANADHVHRGVSSFAKTGGILRYGDVSLTPGTSVTINDNLDGSYTINSVGASGSTAQSYQLDNLGLRSSVTGNAWRLELKQGDGVTDPSSGTQAVTISFRDTTSASGDFITRTIAAPLSLTIPSGATIGMASATGYNPYVYAIDNAGTVHLGLSLTRFDEGSVQSVTGVSASSFDNSFLWSDFSASSRPVRLIGRTQIAEPTAGTYSANATEVSVNPFSRKRLLVKGQKGDSQSFPSSTESLVQWSFKTFDTHNAFDLSTNMFTAPIAGKYRVQCKLRQDGNSRAGTQQNWIIIYVNGVRNTELAYYMLEASGGLVVDLNGDDIIQLNKGDQLGFYLYLEVVGTNTVANDPVLNHFTIELIE